MFLRRSRTDDNQGAIVDALRAIGASVAITSQVGDGFPDLVVASFGEHFLMEVKVPGGRLTPAQVDFYRGWAGPVYIVETEAEAIAVVTHKPTKEAMINMAGYQ